MSGGTTVTSGFTTEQITSITSAINSAISNVLTMFVQVLPLMALICGLGFGVGLILRLFKKVGRARS